VNRESLGSKEVHEWVELQKQLYQLGMREPADRCRETGSRLVGSFEELCESFRLVYEEYLRWGLTDAHHSRMRYQVHQLLPVSQSFIAYRSGSVAGTGSVVLDSPAGLPSSPIFGDVFSALKRGARRVAEGTMLACRDVGEVPAHRTAWGVIAQAISWSILVGVDDFCIVVNPRHFKFWHETMGFEVLGEERPCEHVKSQPGIFLRLDLKGIREQTLRPCEGLEKVAVAREVSPDDLRSDYSLSPEQAELLLRLRPELLPSVFKYAHQTLTPYYHEPVKQRAAA
jgi:hypothetical protein